MIDGISLWTRQKGLAAYLLICSELDFIIHHKRNDVEYPTYTANHHGLHFTISPFGLVRIRGSLHKFFNKDKQNYDDFTLHKLRDTIIHLRDNFEIDLELLSIHKLEWGVNLKTPFPAQAFLNTLLSYKGKPFNSKYDGNYKECELHQLLLKFYNKGLQYKQSGDILRIELKITKMTACKGEGLTLNDLLRFSTWEILFSQLLNVYDLIIMDDIIDKTLLSVSQKKIYEFGINPNNWNKNKLTPNSRYKKRQQFNPIIKEYGQCQYKEVALTLMKEKYKELLQG